MKVALPVWENRISPLFDSARMLLVVDLENEMMTSRRYIPFQANHLFHQATRLTEMGVSVLICGAISQDVANLIEAHGIRIIPFVAGDVDRVITAYIEGGLPRAGFHMPGCGVGHRHAHRGKRSEKPITVHTPPEEVHMPRGDKTGPTGRGARTGRGMGPCGNRQGLNPDPGDNARSGPGRNRNPGKGRGQGRGRKTNR